MTEVEAELLSIYSGDSDDLGKRSPLRQSNAQLDKGKEDLEISGDLSVFQCSTAADELSDQPCGSSAANMAKNYYSEDNLLSSLSLKSQCNERSLSCRTISKFSLPDLGRKRVTSSESSSSSAGKKCSGSKSRLHRLKEAPSKLLKLFRPSRPSPVLSEETLCDPDRSSLEARDDFPIFQLKEEPKGSCYQYVLLSPMATDSPQIGSHSLAPRIPNIVTNTSTSPPDARQTRSLIPPTTSEMLHLCPTFDTHDSLHSPLLIPLTDSLHSPSHDPNAERSGTRHSSITSGIVSASPSMMSRHFLSQISVESVEKSWLSSSEPPFSDSRKDSVISEHASLYSSPIYEHPGDEGKVRSHISNDMPEQSQDYIPLPERNRAHSYGEESFRKIRPRGLSAVSHSGSSGYSSCANSKCSSIQSSMAHVATSQESLETASPFPCPHAATVKRGGSLKAYSRYSTREYSNYHAKLHQSHKSLD